MSKVVLKLEMHDDKIKQKVMKTVSGLTGVETIAMDSKDKKLTVTGNIDPVKVVGKLRKLCHTDIVSVGPAKEPEKKKEEPKKDGEGKKGGGDADKKEAAREDAAQFMKAYQYHQAYYQPPPPPHQYHYAQPGPAYYRPAEEDPNACVIC